MSSDVVLFCEHLKSAIGSQDTKRAQMHLDAIDQYFNDRISENEIDLAIERVFSEDNGVLGFLKTCLNQCKLFRDNNVKAFELLAKVIELHSKKVISYATNVVIICLQYIRSMHTSARESEKAGAVIEKLISKNCCEPVDRCYLMSELLKIAQLSTPGTVQCRIFGLIGCFAKDYPDCIENDGDGVRIRDMYFKALEDAVINKHNTTFVSLSGAINGLNDFLENFAPSEQHREEFAKRLYKCIKPLAKPSEKNTQKTVNRCALNILARRCQLFGKQIFDDFFFWHDLLVNTWLKMDQYENRRPAIYLLHAIHRDISDRLLHSSDSTQCRVILTFLQNFFKTTLESSISQPFEIRLSIVGFGLLAASCKKLLDSNHLNELFRLVMQRTKSVVNAVSHNSKEQLEHFPDYVEALSRIMEQINQLSGVELNIVQEIIVSIIRHFHLLSTALHQVTINTLIRTFHNLFKLGSSVIDDILEKVIYQGVIWTCSHKLPFDAKNDWSADIDWKDQVTYTSYLPLWNGFLTETESVSCDNSVIVSKIYDQMMCTLFKIMDKLNMSVRKRIYRDDHGKDQELFFSDPNYDLEPECVKDFHIFFNLVDFYQDILKAQSLDSHKKHFLKWLNQLVEVLITKSLKNPLVSGFLKLMQTILRITNRLDYFGNTLYEDSSINYNNLYYYLSIHIRKAQQSSGELQVACLKLLFSMPTCMLCTLVHDMVPVFQIAFDIGKSNASLFMAQMSLSAIERYLNAAKRESDERRDFLYAVLPYFDAYLQGFKNDPVKSVEITRHRIQGAKANQKLVKIKENDLLKFQKRVILFLGTLEPEYCQCLMRNDEKTSLIKWNTTQTVHLTLYSSNFNPKICMDALIPRICEIATSTTDRQKKMSACEIIQATIIYLIGSYNHRGKLWSELCKLMLELGCDGDVGVQQMFEPLVMQIMHYMSKDDQLNHAGSEILLKCLMDAISHPTNLSVRDIASRSLREFLSWTFRQSKPEQLAASPFNIVTLIHHLKMFNSDTLHQRRFGAALAFNNIYRVLREEEVIVDKYWLDLLHDFCINFNLSEQQLEENLNSQTDLKQVSSSLDHVLRVLRECKQLFNTPNPDRMKPASFPNCLLRDAVLWLLGQCNRPQNLYRKKVMDLFLALAPCVEGYSSAAAFIRDTQTTESVIDLCESGLEIDHIDLKEFETTYTWLKRLHTTLDCYAWFIENNFMLTWNSVFKSSGIFKALQHYIDNIMNKNLFAEAHGMDKNLISQRERMNREKSAVLLQFFIFVNKTLAIGCVPSTIWESCELIWAAETTIFRAQFLECDTKNPEILSHLTKCMESFITNANRFAPNEFRNVLNDKLVNNMIDIYQSLANSIGEILNRNSISTSDANNLSGISLICGLIRAKVLVQDDYVKSNIDILATKVLYEIFEGIKEKQGDVVMAKLLTPDTVKFTSRLLQICFSKNGIHINLIDLLLNTTELVLCDSLKSVKHGKHFLTLYKTTIYQYFLKNSDLIVDRLISKILPPNVSHVLRMLIDITEYAHKAGPQNITRIKTLTNVLLGNWSDIESRSKADQNLATTMALIDLVGRIAMICPYVLTEIPKKAQGMENWLLKILSSTHDEFNIEIKTQAIFLIPCLVGSMNYVHGDLEKVLIHFQKQYFPLCTEELRMGSVDRTSYENVFQAILDTMCASQSPVILKFVINCTAQDTSHIMNNTIVESVQKFMTTQKLENQLHCLNLVFDMFTKNAHDPAIRMVLMKRFLTHMIMSSLKETIIQFYASHIRQIEILLDASYGLHMVEYKLEQAFTSRIGGFELLEILVAILTRDEICDKTCPIVIAKFGNNVQKGNELLAWMSLKAVNTKAESFRSDNDKYMEWFRKYQCAAFKTLCAIICNTQKELKFFEKWVFIEKNWLNMINTSKDDLYISHSLEVDKRPKINERLVSIRKQNDGTAATSSRKYIESQNVFESSLSQDVTKIDLSCSYVRTTEEVEQQKLLANYQPKTLLLEKNSVNDHEVMATLCGVIEHMFDNKITPINDDGTVRRQKLPWVENFCNIISNTSNDMHINIRIFLVTAVDNCRKLFCNYADVLSIAILKFLKDWIGRKKCIDALVIFLTVNLLEWDAVYRINTFDEQNLASDLMAKLMEHCYSQQKDVFRRNLELIRNLMEKWCGFIQLPHELLYNKIANTNIECKENICGIHLNGIVLANDLVPWTDETKQSFLRAICDCLNNVYSDVYQPAAQVLGMMLHKIVVKHNMGNDDVIKNIVAGLTTRLKGWKQSNEKKFMYTIFYMDKHFVIKEFLTPICSSIASSTSDAKKLYLQMYLARVNESDSRDIEIILIDLLNQSEEHQHQLIGLHIFNKALPKMSINQIKSILPRIASFQDSKHTETRDVVYEIMKYVRGNFSVDDELNQRATNILLNGLNDVNKELQSTVFEYWNKSHELPSALNERVLYMLRHLYNRDFLKYAVQLLIDLKSPDLKKKLLRERTEEDDSKYTEYDINVNWKSQDSTLRVPLFTESQQKHIINADFDPAHSYLRATQHSLLFDPTLDPATIHQISTSFSLQSQSSLQFEVNPRVLDRRSQFKEPTERTTQTKFTYLRERILRSKNVVNRERALSAVKKQNYRKIQENQQGHVKDGQVMLYRRYRFGDYPDFLINSLAFLLPLHALVELDAILARNTFVTVLNAVFKELEDHQKQSFLRDLTITIETIIKQPNSCDPMLFSALAEIALTNNAVLNISPGIATAIPNASDMMINAILLFENRLNSSSDAADEIWTELANMYYNLSEYEVTASIFSDKIQSDHLLSDAIELESNGDFQNALKLYMELINKSSDSEDAMMNSLNKHISDFSYQSLFNCYEMMGRWEDLESNVYEQLIEDDMANYEQLWTDEWNAKNLLPHYIRSEVRLFIYTKTNGTRKFLENIQQWLRNSERGDFIKKHFGEELMILHIANKDYLQAKVFSNQYFEGFLNEWSAMTILSDKMRNNKLMNTRRVAEIHKYADLLSQPIDDTVIAELTDRWNGSQMHKTDSSQMWEALISYRIFVTEHALEKFPLKDAPIIDRLIEGLFDMQFKLNEIALQQQNIELSNSVLGRLNSFSRAYRQNTSKSSLQYDLACFRQNQIKYMNQKPTNPTTTFDHLLDIWAKLQQFVESHRAILDANPDIKLKIADQFNELTSCTYEIVSKCTSIDSSAKQKIMELTGCSDEAQHTSQHIENFSRRCFDETIQLAEKCEQNRSQMLSTNTTTKEHDIGDSYYRLAIFCFKHYKTDSILNEIETAKLLIKSILRGMRHDSKNARLQFPRLLQIINTPELSVLFNQEIEKVPLWTFLRSISQIMARFDFDKMCFLDSLVLRLATAYPSVVIYSIQLEHGRFYEQKPKSIIRPLIQQILDAIENPLIKKFIDSTKCLSFPEKVMQHHLHNILNHTYPSEKYHQELKACYDNVFENALRGKSANTVQQFKENIVELMQMHDREKIKEALHQLLEKLKKVKSKHKSVEKLSIFSPWLAQYHWYGCDNFIEFPGQHKNDTPPNPNTSLKIVKFLENVSICHSLRKPIKISAICSDGSIRSFLVKYGEDLRQDERIQHIQELMSDQMKLDRNCSQQQLSLQIYKVIPLNTHCGLISWIENTDSIQSFLSSSDPKWDIVNTKVRKSFEDFISDGAKHMKKAIPHVGAVLHYKASMIAQNMEKLREQLPENGLRNSLFKLSASPECFFALRNNFGKSLAAMSIAHWLLGIGDRNLGNYLINKSNGKLIGIDFNLAFGAATRNYNIPELVPFRLTSQFVNVLKPLGVSGFLIKSMAHVLRTFSLENESIMAALEVFISEPTTDFNDALSRSSTSSQGTADSSSVKAWKPEQHLKVVKDKLSGINPIIPIENDLKFGFYFCDTNIVLAYTKLLNGSPNALRTKLRKQGLSVEEQVKCLIDIATDPSVLGISYIGFQPWA